MLGFAPPKFKLNLMEQMPIIIINGFSSCKSDYTHSRHSTDEELQLIDISSNNNFVVMSSLNLGP